MIPTVSLEFNCLKVRYGEIVHLHVRMEHFNGYQSWTCGARNYGIEYYVNGQTIRCDYAKREHWTAIIMGLEKLL